MLPLRQITPLLICVLCGTAAAGNLPTHRLDAGPGTVRTVRAMDLTGDGKADIVAFTDGPDGISISIWCADRDGGFPGKTPDLVVVPKRIGLGSVYYAFLAVLGPGEPAAIVLVDREKGVVRITVVSAEKKWVVHGPEKIAEAPKLPFFPDDRRIAVLDAAADLNADGDDELILPTATGYAVIDPGRTGSDEAGSDEAGSDEAGSDGSGEAPVRLIGTGNDHRLTAGAHRFFSLHWQIPRMTVADYDADGLPDLIASRGNRFLIYLQDKTGQFQEESRRVDLLAPEPWAKESATFVLGDVDGDGKVDLLVTQTPTSVKVMGDFSSQHSLFLNPRIFARRTEGRLSTPASTFRTGGTCFNARLFDFDGDGDLDLLVGSLEIDLGSQIRKDVSAEYSVFLFERENGESGFDSSSRFSITRTYPWERLQRGSTPAVCFFEGDFNGDGQKDLVDIADEGHLTILTGERGGGLFASAYSFTEEEDGNPLFRAKADVESDLIIRDLDGDGASDLVAYREDKIYVIRGAKGGGK